MRWPYLIPLLLLLAPTATAAWGDSTQSLGDGAHPGGFSLDGDRLEGLYLDATTTTQGLGAVHLDGEPLLVGLTWGTGTWSTDGPLAVHQNDDGALSVHDNRFGWITVRGEVGTITLTGTTDWTLDDHTATSGRARVFLERSGSMDAEADRLVLTFDGPAGLALTTTPGIFGHAPRAGAWAALHFGAADTEDATADWLRVHGAPFRLTGVGEGRFTLDLVGTLGDGAADLLLRLDLHGAPAGGVVLRMAGRIASQVPMEQILQDAQGAFSYNLTDDPASLDTRILWMRLPAGLSGHLEVDFDAVSPQIAVTTSDLDPWNPQQRIPTLLVVSDEPSTAILLVGEDYEKRTVVLAFEHSFRLIGLEPDTHYPYQVIVQDPAGNQAHHMGTFQTGNATGGSRHINATAESLEDGSWRIVANVTDQTGSPVQGGVTFFVDKQAVVPVRWSGAWVHTMDNVPPGDHEVVVEATGPDGRERHVMSIHVPSEAEAPALPLASVAVAALAALALRRRQ